MGTVIELYMPLVKYWQIEKWIKKANYIASTGESSAEVLEVYKKVFRLCAEYAVREQERKWLYDKAKD